MVEVVKYSATGRRKSSIARVTISPGTGIVIVNKRAFDNYFPRETDRLNILAPTKLTNTNNKLDIRIRVVGGGSTGQTGAVRLGLARSLVLMDKSNHGILRKSEFLTRDPREKERKKPGQKGARKKFQWVKR